MGVSVLIRRITLAALVAALAGGTLAIPASSKPGPVASASKCKKAKKGKHKKKKKCGRSSPSETTLPGQATHTVPNQPPPPPATPGVSAIGVTDNPVLGGGSTTGQVTLDAAAPSGGQTVALQSDLPGRADVLPASVVVAAGQTSASFQVDTTAGPAVTATLSASIGASVASTQLRIVSDPSVDSVALERACFTPGTYNSNRVTLDVTAPADTAVDLSDDSSFLDVAPPTTTVPSGSKSAFFSAIVSPLATPTNAMVTATLGSSHASDSASLNPTSPDPNVTGLSLSPDSVTAGSPSTATVTLDCEASSGGAVVDLSSNLAGVTVPMTVTVPQDQLSASFQVNTAGTANGDATITASRGASQRTAVLHVNNLGT